MGIPSKSIPVYLRGRIVGKRAAVIEPEPIDKLSSLERRFITQWAKCGRCSLASQVKFHDTRKWRLDFAHVGTKVGIEIHGATWRKGRHTSGAGFANDREKMNAAIALGWVVFELTAQQITPDHLAPIMETIARRQIAEAGMDRIQLTAKGSAIARRVMDPNDPTGKRVRLTPKQN